MWQTVPEHQEYDECAARQAAAKKFLVQVSCRSVTGITIEPLHQRAQQADARCSCFNAAKLRTRLTATSTAHENGGFALLKSYGRSVDALDCA